MQQQKHMNVEQNANKQLVSLTIASDDRILIKIQNRSVAIALNAAKNINNNVTN